MVYSFCQLQAGYGAVTVFKKTKVNHVGHHLLDALIMNASIVGYNLRVVLKLKGDVALVHGVGDQLKAVPVKAIPLHAVFHLDAL